MGFFWFSWKEHTIKAGLCDMAKNILIQAVLCPNSNMYHNIACFSFNHTQHIRCTYSYLIIFLLLGTTFYKFTIKPQTTFKILKYAKMNRNHTVQHDSCTARCSLNYVDCFDLIFHCCFLILHIDYEL